MWNTYYISVLRTNRMHYLLSLSLSLSVFQFISIINLYTVLVTDQLNLFKTKPNLLYKESVRTAL
jgi:hypothetical protein